MNGNQCMATGICAQRRAVRPREPAHSMSARAWQAGTCVQGGGGGGGGVLRVGVQQGA